MTEAAPAGLRCILIGGRSHVGKSSVAAYLAGRLGWASLSTDRLGSHPGRPWGAMPDHVVAHYSDLDDAAILEAVIAHQRGMWPGIEALIRERLATGSESGLVLEGSAIMPREAAALGLDGVAAVWLTGSDAFLRGRIEAESGYKELATEARFLIDRFIERNQRLDRVLKAEAMASGMPMTDVDGRSVSDAVDACLQAMKRLG